MKYKPIIIGIAGKRQSGKDTVASMINYILSRGLALASYHEWKNYYELYKSSDKIIHFADKLKEYCSQIFNIPIKYFNNTDYKDNYVWCMATSKFIKRDELDTNTYYEIKIDKFEEFNNNLIDYKNYINVKLSRVSVISIRTILQYIGTNIFRNYIDRNIWVNLTIEKAKIIADKEYCIISDVRFENEAIAIRKTKYKNIIILIDRNTNNNDTHKSENIDFDCTHYIENNSTLMTLFYKILMLLKSEIK